LFFGLIHEKVRHEFWVRQSDKRRRSFNAFDDARRGEISLREAIARYNEIRPPQGLVISPKWPIITQTTLLVLGVLGIFLAVLFSLLSI
jgi:hypothetical protein